MASTYLTRTPSSAGNLKKWTWSAWIKKSLSDGADVGVFGQYVDSNNYFRIRYRSDQRLQVDNYNSGSATFSVILGVEHRDPSGWYHLVVAYDSAQGTDSNRVKIYVNGVLQTVFQTAAYPSVNVDTKIPNTGSAIELGRTTQNQYFNGYMNNVAFVDGTALTPTSFGETDSTSGIWKFKSPSGITWGTNGVHLKMDNSGNLGLDSSGQTNNFTLSGNGRQAKDTPTNVHCTANPLARYSGNLNYSNGNNTTTGSANDWTMGSSTMGASTGKWYYEYKLTTVGTGSGYFKLGFISDEAFANNTGHIAESALDGGYAFYCNNGNLEVRTDAAVISGYSQSDLGVSFSMGDIMCLAVDMTNKRAYFRKNGDAWIKSANPVNGTNGLDISADYTAGKAMIPAFAIYYPGVASLNFGNGYFGTTAITSAGSNGNGSLFEYDVPSGYYALNTKNINTYG